MSRSNQRHLEFVAWPAYVLGIAMFMEPMSDAVLAVWPLRFGTLSWRFGSVGVLSGGLMTPVLALLIVTTAAIALEHLRIQRMIGVFSGVFGFGILIMTAVFALDSIATKSVMEAGGAVTSIQYSVTVVKAVIKLLMAGGAAGGLSWAALKSSVELTHENAVAPGLVASARRARGEG